MKTYVNVDDERRREEMLTGLIELDLDKVLALQHANKRLFWMVQWGLPTLTFAAFVCGLAFGWYIWGRL